MFRPLLRQRADRLSGHRTSEAVVERALGIFDSASFLAGSAETLAVRMQSLLVRALARSRLEADEQPREMVDVAALLRRLRACN